MPALLALIDLIARLGAELDFDVARNVEGLRGGPVDAVWLNPRLPLAAIGTAALDLRHAPVLPAVAFAVRTAAMLDTAEIASVVTRLEGTGAPLRILIVARHGGHSALAPLLKSVDQLHGQDEDAALGARIAESLQADTRAPGRTLVMLQHELTDWARRVREVKPRSYSAESLFHRTGKID